MPEISRFYGIIIQMFFKDHLPAHFHVKYGRYQSKVNIETGNIIEGKLPKKQIRLVQAWAELHKNELKQNFKECQKDKPEVFKISPLK